MERSDLREKTLDNAKIVTMAKIAEVEIQFVERLWFNRAILRNYGNFGSPSSHLAGAV